MASIDIPFRLVELENEENVMPLVEGELNGHLIRMVVDTGASHSCFDRASVKKYAPKAFPRNKVSCALTDSGDKDTVMGLGGRRISHTICRLNSLKIGDLELTDYKVVAVRLGSINKMLHWIGQEPIDGLLGCDVLQSHAAVLDFKALCIRMQTGETVNNSADENQNISLR